MFPLLDKQTVFANIESEHLNNIMGILTGDLQNGVTKSEENINNNLNHTKYDTN